MRESEILEAYNELKDLELKELELELEELITSHLEVGRKRAIESLVTHIRTNEESIKSIVRKNELIEACKEEISKPAVSLKIKETLNNNHNSVNCFLEIAQIVAPAIAQMYLGLSAMTIVGAILVLCKQGIQKYLIV